MAALPVRHALASLTEILGDPRKVLYSAGSILAAFACSPSTLDQALETVAAKVNHSIDVPALGARNLIRVGVMGAVHFYAEIKPGDAVVSFRLFSPGPGSQAPQDWTTAHKLAEAAFLASGDPRQALMSYVSSKLLGDPSEAQLLASDLARLVSDYMRMQAAGDAAGVRAA